MRIVCPILFLPRLFGPFVLLTPDLWEIFVDVVIVVIFESSESAEFEPVL